MEKLLRFGDTGSGALTSELVQLCPTTFATVSARHTVTTDSADLDRPGASPWLWNFGAAVVRNPRYPRVPDQLLLPSTAPQAFPTDRSAPPPPNSEFDPRSWRSLTAALGRIDLGRPLVEYPPAASRSVDLRGFLLAQTARQNLARDIYVRLLSVSGAYDPMRLMPSAILPNNTLPIPPELQALRWLAQLAVNIVDDIDPDDVMTPFHWSAVGSPDFRSQINPDQGWVFGTELPHVVITEVYAEYLNEPGEVGQGVRATQYRVNL